jgi:hypothetical protein
VWATALRTTTGNLSLRSANLNSIFYLLTVNFMNEPKEVKVEVKVEVKTTTTVIESKKDDLKIGGVPYWMKNIKCTNEGYGVAD